MAHATIANPALRRGPDERAVLRLLRARDTAYWAKTMAAFVFGGALSLVGPLVVAVVVYTWVGDGSLGFSGLYERCAMIFLPIAYLIAWLTPGSVLESVMEDRDSAPGRHRMLMILLAEIANIGPRLVMLGIKLARSRAAVGRVYLPRAAEAVGVLWVAGGGIAPVKLLHAGESAEHLQGILGLLLVLQVADVSKNGDRVWLGSDVRGRLR